MFDGRASNTGELMPSVCMLQRCHPGDANAAGRRAALSPLEQLPGATVAYGSAVKTSTRSALLRRAAYAGCLTPYTLA